MLLGFGWGLGTEEPSSPSFLLLLMLLRALLLYDLEECRRRLAFGDEEEYVALRRFFIASLDWVDRVGEEVLGGVGFVGRRGEASPSSLLLGVWRGCDGKGGFVVNWVGEGSRVGLEGSIFIQVGRRAYNCSGAVLLLKMGLGIGKGWGKSVCEVEGVLDLAVGTVRVDGAKEARKRGQIGCQESQDKN